MSVHIERRGLLIGIERINDHFLFSIGILNLTIESLLHLLPQLSFS